MRNGDARHPKDWPNFSSPRQRLGPNAPSRRLPPASRLALPVPPQPTPPRARAAVALAVAALLLLFWWLAVSASRVKSQTCDELPHIAAGYAYDRFGDFRMHPENGNLPQRIFGLAGVAVDAKFPLDEARWRDSQYWQLSWDYLYALGNPTDRIVQGARSLNALFGVALGLLIFGVTRARFGNAGGLLALAFYALSPTFLAHSALATSDVCAALFLTLAPWLFWRHLEKRDFASGLLAGLASGLALVAKFNGVLIAPLYALLVVADAWLRADPTRRARTRRFAANFALATAQALAGWVIIWAFYEFRYDVRGPGAPAFVSFHCGWDRMLPSLGWKAWFVEAALRWHLFPQTWMFGLTFVVANEVARPAFFAGEHSQFGWWLFFPALFLTKTPLALLGALLLAAIAGIVAWLRAAAAPRRAWLIAACPLAVTATVVWAVALRSNLNIGDRHILAVYPALFVALGVLATRRSLLVTGFVLLAGHAAASFAIRPHYLASFNTLAGGPANAHRLFVDSSLDWGQDLPTLGTWLGAQRRPGEKVFLGYFGNAWPPHYGVRPDRFLPSISQIVRPPYAPFELEPGLYCISATLLAEVYSIYRGPWTDSHEQRWQLFRATPPGPADADAEEFAYLRFARLCKYLQFRDPDANAGYSILIFRLTAADLRAALEGPVTGAYRMRPVRP